MGAGTPTRGPRDDKGFRLQNGLMQVVGKVGEELELGEVGWVGEVGGGSRGS